MQDALDYEHAKACVAQSFRHMPSRFATAIRRELVERICLLVLGRTGPARAEQEREAARHIRKMLAEGEIEEEMCNKRLFYKLPVHERTLS